MTTLEKVADAIAQKLVACGALKHANDASSAWAKGPCLLAARAALEALKAGKLVFREGGEVVHELRGAPDDIWQTLLDSILSEKGEG